VQSNVDVDCHRHEYIERTGFTGIWQQQQQLDAYMLPVAMNGFDWRRLADHSLR